MPPKKYKLSFTAASLSVMNSIQITEIYLKYKDWALTKQAVKEGNVLQSRTNSRAIRVMRELIQRLEMLTDDQLELIASGSPTEQKYLLWFAACKTYKLIEEFAVEVLHEKFLGRNLILTDMDYDAFFNRKADWNEGLNQITNSTQKKIRQVLLLMAKEAELLSDDNQILRAMLSNRLIEALRPEAPTSFQVFPIEPFQPKE